MKNTIAEQFVIIIFFFFFFFFLLLYVSVTLVIHCEGMVNLSISSNAVPGLTQALKVHRCNKEYIITYVHIYMITYVHIYIITYVHTLYFF